MSCQPVRIVEILDLLFHLENYVDLNVFAMSIHTECRLNQISLSFLT